MVVEVKQTLSCETIGKYSEQLKHAKEGLESWFSTEISQHWRFIPLAYCESMEIDETFCESCHNFIIKGEKCFETCIHIAIFSTYLSNFFRY